MKIVFRRIYLNRKKNKCVQKNMSVPITTANARELTGKTDECLVGERGKPFEKIHLEVRDEM